MQATVSAVMTPEAALLSQRTLAAQLNARDAAALNDEYPEGSSHWVLPMDPVGPTLLPADGPMVARSRPLRPVPA